MRLQKFISKSGYTSRRKAEELIRNGLVEVNGEIVTEMGIIVDSDCDIVKIKGTVISLDETTVYIVLNKPKGVVTTLSDNFNRPIVTDFIKVDERIYPVGRLDYDSKGLVLLTNNGDLTNLLTHPRHHISKTYLVKINKTLSQDEMRLFRHGIDIGGYITAKCKIQLKNDKTYEIVLWEGKNRQIRRMFAALNREVVSLQRTAIGSIGIGSLKEGAWRHLTKLEVDNLKNAASAERTAEDE